MTELLRRQTCSRPAEAQDEGLSGEGVLVSRLIIFILVRLHEFHLIFPEVQNTRMWLEAGVPEGTHAGTGRTLHSTQKGLRWNQTCDLRAARRQC